MSDHIVDPIDILPHPAPADDHSRLLLFTMRRVAAHGLDDAHAAHAMLCSFGMSFRRPLVLLRALMAEASRVSSRRILVAPCCCPRMTTSEANLLSAVAAARHDPHGAHRLLTEVLGIADCLGTLSSAQALAQAFEDLAKPLPSPA
ncbi:hypothetical protein SAMN06295912_101173 [Sphingomonas laterariae]|uniref:Uncharacterized protein n=1 Tax=Edaphosphingomonas laterariae TaxID=861865 RepID=A0A239BHV2_9SPHN|nr:DUF6628 family protein [Sphingomonas laterariae]SNS07396.1 hypothetical protein SAMN06295912_101173 [Sphingomonas laterariae]